ncbi:hypothetical protein CC80DRAFT_506333 [Byssothecium circinans]|uniref:Uncharacterized protein n=1 Tax=Byssothecium circinans TaxID=147558 RepID=A0A6A5TRE7_9PLEO|nr:hypothetical protein CC80DRAFT_506333 [Byssothecium circinans]
MPNSKNNKRPRTRAHRAVTNVFGIGSPHQNLPFPKGSLTAAEIIAYTPHWLRSIDVIDRFVTNGSQAGTIAAMLNEFRHQPDNKPINANSICSVMQIPMRHAGFEGWTKGTHGLVERNDTTKEWDDTVLDVSTFRTPRVSHPRGTFKAFMNSQQDPISFKNLALHVKKHPEGPDALDLTRCVQHALSHPEKSWLFPNDYERLVKELGGPAPVTSAHLDKQVFARHDPAVRLPAFNRPDSSSSVYTVPTSTTVNAKIMPRRSTRAAVKGDTSFAPSSSRRNASSKIDESPVSAHKNGARRSGRLAGRVRISLNEEFTETDSPWKPSTRKRKPSPDNDDGDFNVNGESSDSDTLKETEADNVSDESSTPAPKQRRAAKKARVTIQEIATFETPVKPKVHSAPISPALMAAARIFTHKPKFLKPPVLPRDRATVDNHSVWLYSADTCTTMTERWESALSSTRFNGPRRHPPFRELYRLTDPPAYDVSDWAENIRWAKEQEKVFGSTTWTEYDYYLEQITEERRRTGWFSDEALRGGY